MCVLIIPCNTSKLEFNFKYSSIVAATNRCFDPSDFQNLLIMEYPDFPYLWNSPPFSSFYPKKYRFFVLISTFSEIDFFCVSTSFFLLFSGARFWAFSKNDPFSNFLIFILDFACFPKISTKICQNLIFLWILSHF